jgi:hypothetical protein
MQLWLVFQILKKDAYTIKLEVNKHMNSGKKTVVAEVTRFKATIMAFKVSL